MNDSTSMLKMPLVMTLAFALSACAIDTSAPDAEEASPVRDGGTIFAPQPNKPYPGRPSCRPVFNDDGQIVEYQCPMPGPKDDDCVDCGGQGMDVTLPAVGQ